MNLTKKTRRIAVGALLAGGLGVGAAVAASVTLSSNTLGAGAAAVSSCTGANTVKAVLGDPSWDATSKGFLSSTVKVSSTTALTACDGVSYKVVVSKTDGTQLATVSGTWTDSADNGTAKTLDVNVNPADVAQVSAAFYG